MGAEPKPNQALPIFGSNFGLADLVELYWVLDLHVAISERRSGLISVVSASKRVGLYRQSSAKELWASEYASIQR